MPSKHIDEATWKKIQSEHVKAVTETALSLKDTEVLKAIIIKGLEKIEKKDYLLIFGDKKSE